MDFIKRIIQKYGTETFAYLFWGAASFFLNIALFSLLWYIELDYSVANLVTLVVVKIFCYITNKFFVFHSKCDNIHELIKEFIKFFMARFLTFLIDYAGLILLVEIWGVNKLAGKLFLEVLVVVLNYLFSKYLVFRER